MSKVTVIGGSGFIGTNVISILPDDQIINIDKQQSERFPDKTTIANIVNKEEINNTLQPADWVILLAAEHRDDVSPISLYYDVNVEGTRNVLASMDAKGIKKIIFTSSVAVYGLNKVDPDESHPVDPFNDYGKSKYQAEEVLRKWYNENPTEKSLIIIRPTVVFGPGNRGNVYNLLKQLSKGKFLKIGSGNNRKSMAYVDNIAAFIKHCLKNTTTPGYYIYNYSDKPDLTMNELIKISENALNKKVPAITIPYALGYFGGKVLDVLSKISGKSFPISAVRVQKFCATTQFSSKNIQKTNFQPPKKLEEGLAETLKSIVS